MDKKRGVSVLLVASVLFVLMAVPAIAGYRTNVFSGTVFSGTSVDIDDYQIVITMNYAEDRIFINAGDDFASIPKFGCDTLKNIIICFTNTTFDEDELRTYLEVEINKTDPELAITRTIAETEFYTGQEQLVTVDVTNTGDIANNVTYYEDWGEEFEIVEMEEGPCSVERSAVIWKGYLSETRDLQCEFTIKALEEVKKGVIGSVEYYDGYKMETEYSSELNVEVKGVIDVKHRTVHEDEEPEETQFDWEEDDIVSSIGEEIRLALNLTSKLADQDWVRAEVKLQFPKGIEYNGAGYIIHKQDAGTTVSGYKTYTEHRLSGSSTMREDSSNTLSWKGKLWTTSTDEDSEVFILKMLTKRTGLHNILLTIDAEDEDGNEYSQQEYIKLKTIDRGMWPVLYIVDPDKRFELEEPILPEEDTREVESLNEYRIRIQVENLNPYGGLNNVHVTARTNLTNFTDAYFPSIEADGAKIPHSFSFTVPRSEEDVEMPIYLTVEYQTEYGQRFTNSTEFDIKTVAFDDVDINQEFDTTTLEGDEESLVTINLKNNRLVTLKGVELKDIIDPRFTVEGVHSLKLNLKPGEEVDVYTYTLTAPRIDREDDSFFVNTTLKYYDPDHQKDIYHHKYSTMTVQPKELDITITRDIETADVTVGEILDVDYTITNSEDDEVMKDITLNLPLSWSYDIVGPSVYKVSKLGPGESITLDGKQKVRIKHNDTTEIDETLVVYHDIYGTRMEENSSTSSIDIDELPYYTGPTVFVNRTLMPEQAYANRSTKLTFRVVNKGDEEADVMINESGEELTVKVPPESERLVQYTRSIPATGTEMLEEPVVTYTYQGQTFTTLGEGGRITVVPAPVELTAEEEDEEAPVQVPTVTPPDIPQPDMEEEEGSGISARFLLELFLVLVVLAVIAAYIVYRTRGEAAPPVLEE